MDIAILVIVSVGVAEQARRIVMDIRRINKRTRRQQEMAAKEAIGRHPALWTDAYAPLPKRDQ